MRERKKLTTPIQEAHLSPGNGVQIIGKVNPDLSIKVLTALDLGISVGESRPLHGTCPPSKTPGAQYPSKGSTRGYTPISLAGGASPMPHRLRSGGHPKHFDLSPPHVVSRLLGDA
jgi:hypothetical protein